MTTSTVTAGKDSWVGSGYPNRTHKKARKLRLDSGEAYGFVYAKSPVPRGHTVGDAKLQVHVAGGWTGTKTIKLRRVASRLDWSDLTWNNKPGVTGASQPSVTVTDAVDGQLLEFNVTNHLQTVADGDPHYGWRLETDSTTAVRVYSFDSDDPPRLVVTHSGKPGAPTDLTPDGGRAVSVAKPVLRFTAPDLNSEDDIVALRVWIDPAMPGSAPAFDSGEIATTVPELDLSTTAYAGLADGASTSWKVWWKNSNGTQSEWSDWATFSRVSKPAVNITVPSGAETVTTVTPPLEASLAAGTLRAWMVRIVDPAKPSRIIAESGKIKAAAGNLIAWTPPARALQDDTAYQAQFFAWDAVDRVATPGDPRYIRAVRNFTIDDDALVEAPVLTSVTQTDGRPIATLTFTRSVAPDGGFTIYRDGEVVDADVDAAEASIGGTSYQWTEPAASPLSSHTYRVRAVSAGVQSVKSNAITAQIVPLGVWLIQGNRSVTLSDDDGISGWEKVDQVGIYTVHGRSKPVMIRAALGSLSGGFAGVMKDEDGRTLASYAADLEAIRTSNEPCTIIAADYAGKVWLYNVTDTIHEDSDADEVWHRVSFRFIEAD